MPSERWAFQLGDRVRPRREWRLTTPSGKVTARQTWAEDGCYRIDDSPVFWAAHVFERDDAKN